VSFADVANYRVFVMNQSSRIPESLPAALEIGPVSTIVSHTKPQDLFMSETAAVRDFAPQRSRPAVALLA